MEKINYIKDVLKTLNEHGRITNNDGCEYETDFLTHVNDPGLFRHAVDNIDKITPNTKLGFKIRQKSIKDNSYTFIDATPSLLQRIFELVPRLHGMWKGIKHFIDAFIEYRKQHCALDDTELHFKDFDDNINHCLDLMDDGVAYHLYKPRWRRSCESRFQPTVRWSFFSARDEDKLDALVPQLPCVGSHNGRVILEFKQRDGFDKYGDPIYTKRFVGVVYDEIVDKFMEYSEHVKEDDDGNESSVTVSIDPIDEKYKKHITKALVRHCNDLFMEIQEQRGHNRASLKFVTYDNNPKYTEEHISDKIRELWDVKLGGLDARTNTSLTDSYMTMLGWYFSPAKFSDRFCGSFYSKSSGFGKTAILEALCKKTDTIYSRLDPGDGPVNQFTFAGELAKGPDILQCDDPMAATDSVLDMVSRLITNKKYDVEFKGKDRYTLENLNTKVMITSNVPLYMKNDSNNFLTEKLFELQTNIDMKQGRPFRDDVEAVVDYIYSCKTPEICAFLNKCVKMYKDNPDWIEQHLGQYTSTEDASLIFRAVLDLEKLKDPCSKTLIDCVKDSVRGYDPIRCVANKEDQKAWNKLCKHIRLNHPDIATRCACILDKENRIYSPTSVHPAQKMDDFTLLDVMRDLAISAFNSTNKTTMINNITDVDNMHQSIEGNIREISKKYLDDTNNPVRKSCMDDDLGLFL